MRKRGKRLEEAVREGLRKWTWRHGVTLVQYGDGSFEVIPPDYLTEIIWVGYEHVERVFGNLRNRALDAGLDFPLEESEVRWLTNRIREEALEVPSDVASDRAREVSRRVESFEEL
ncbi:MAG: hypothetical protein R6V13_06190 [Anaerolineae bacterium]